MHRNHANPCLVARAPSFHPATESPRLLRYALRAPLRRRAIRLQRGQFSTGAKGSTSTGLDTSAHRAYSSCLAASLGFCLGSEPPPQLRSTKPRLGDLSAVIEQARIRDLLAPFKRGRGETRLRATRRRTVPPAAANSRGPVSSCGSNRSDHYSGGPKLPKVGTDSVSRHRFAMRMARAGIEPATPRFSGTPRSGTSRREMPANSDSRCEGRRARIPADMFGYRRVQDPGGAWRS